MERKPHSRRPLRVKLAVFACTGVALALAAATYLAIPPMRARRIFAKVELLQVGKSTFSEVQQLVGQLGAEQIEPQPGTVCSAAECEWKFGTSNFSVPGWWRGYGQAFLVSIHVKNGLVDRRELLYFIGDGSVLSDVYVLEKRGFLGNPRERRWTKGEGTQGHFIVNVYMTPSDPPDIRKRYTAFNWNCLWQYQGCKDEHELMPAADW